MARSPFERIPENDWRGVQRLVEQLNRTHMETGDQALGIRVGSGSVAWPGASARSTTGTINHGLGTTPIFVVGSMANNTGLTADPVITVFTYTATQFSFRVQTVDGQLPANTVANSFRWLAIG